MSVLQPIVDSLAAVQSADGVILAQPFLATCRLILPVLDKLGVAFSAAKSDVGGNIERLAKKASEHVGLFDIALEEVEAGCHASNTGCCKGMLWLKRFLEFTMMLLAETYAAPRSKTLKEAANLSYEKCLKPFHGFFASSAFTVLLQFPPGRDAFVASLGGEGAYQGMQEVVAGFKPTLDKIHQFLEENSLNHPTKV
mmetsp:Transcript_26631/g.42672  ORF Transcript_26631/g.42672 Transcript_26631/m.42672 type:complete len:197 (+) Transcript_26631:164-754(+)